MVRRAGEYKTEPQCHSIRVDVRSQRSIDVIANRGNTSDIGGCP